MFDKLGGMAIVNGMTRNYTLKQVVLADNKVGDDVIILLMGRLNGKLTDMCQSLLTSTFGLVFVCTFGLRLFCLIIFHFCL